MFKCSILQLNSHAISGIRIQIFAVLLHHAHGLILHMIMEAN